MLWPLLILLIVPALLLLVFWGSIPNEWAVHWDLHGQPDAWAHKGGWGIWSPLLLGAVITLVLEIVARGVSRRVVDREGHVRVQRLMRAAGVIPLTILGATSLWLPLGRPRSPLGLILFALATAIFGALAVLRMTKIATAHATAPSRGRPHLWYNDPKDERLWVETPFGWSLNFGHPDARRTFAVLLLAPLFIAIAIAFCAFAMRPGR